MIFAVHDVLCIVHQLLATWSYHALSSKNQGLSYVRSKASKFNQLIFNFLHELDSYLASREATPYYRINKHLPTQSHTYRQTITYDIMHTTSLEILIQNLHYNIIMYGNLRK